LHWLLSLRKKRLLKESQELWADTKDTKEKSAGGRIQVTKEKRLAPMEVLLTLELDQWLKETTT
jgi:hypothetical protein